SRSRNPRAWTRREASVRDSGPVGGAWGKREVPPGKPDASAHQTVAAAWTRGRTKLVESVRGGPPRRRARLDPGRAAGIRLRSRGAVSAPLAEGVPRGVPGRARRGSC